MNESQQQTGYSCPLPTAAEKRRGFITTALMVVGVVLGYGMGAFNFFRYLVPLGRGKREREMFAGTLSDFPVGTAKSIKDPRGEDITLDFQMSPPVDVTGWTISRFAATMIGTRLAFAEMLRL